MRISNEKAGHSRKGVSSLGIGVKDVSWFVVWLCDAKVLGQLDRFEVGS